MALVVELLTRSLNNLIESDCSENYLKYLVGMDNLKGLSKLICHHNKLISHQETEIWKELREFNCSNNGWDSLQWIKIWKELRDCSSNHLTSISILAKMKKFRKIILEF